MGTATGFSNWKAERYSRQTMADEASLSEEARHFGRPERLEGQQRVEQQRRLPARLRGGSTKNVSASPRLKAGRPNA